MRFVEPTFLFHPEHGARQFAPGEEHPGEGWSDKPVKGMAEADPTEREVQRLRVENAALRRELAELQARIAKRRTDPTE